jgi:hypothetical protein
MIVLTFTLTGLAIFTLLIAAEEYRRLKARLRHDFEQAFGHAHRVYPPAPPQNNATRRP